MNFAREGYLFIGIAAVAALAAFALALGRRSWTLWLLAVVITVLVLLLGRPVERLAEKLFHRHATEPPDHSV